MTTFNIPIKSNFQLEEREDTIEYIESKRNWSVEKQAFKIPEKEEHRIEKTTNLADTEIYYRGQYLIVEYNNMIHYWDTYPYCYLTQAVEFMELEKPAKWKTIHALISLRMGIRQTEVNCCGYVEEYLEGKSITQKIYKEFMELARAHDVMHHGSSTF